MGVLAVMPERQAPSPANGGAEGLRVRHPIPPSFCFTKRGRGRRWRSRCVQENLGNQHLTLHIYGNADEIRKTFHPDEDYTYTGETVGNWALTVSDKTVVLESRPLTAAFDLKTRNSGYRFLHVVIKTADGEYFVSEEGAGESTAWIETDYILSDLHWRNLMMTDTPTNASNRRAPDPKRVPIVATSKATPDLSRVEEVGFSDLMPGGWIPATSRVNAFSLFGRAVPRK